MMMAMIVVFILSLYLPVRSRFSRANFWGRTWDKCCSWGKEFPGV